MSASSMVFMGFLQTLFGMYLISSAFYDLFSPLKNNAKTDVALGWSCELQIGDRPKTGDVLMWMASIPLLVYLSTVVRPSVTPLKVVVGIIGSAFIGFMATRISISLRNERIWGQVQNTPDRSSFVSSPHGPQDTTFGLNIFMGLSFSLFAPTVISGFLRRLFME